MKVKINASDRIFVTGRTGSGKSVLMKQLLIPNLANYVIYDYKHEITMPDAVIFQRISDFRKHPNEPAVIYRPGTGSDAEFDQLCKQVFYRGHNTLILDEIASHMTSLKICQWHDTIMRLGRSKGVGIINCTQRPRICHNNVISQCEHFFIFKLTQATDKKKMAEFCGEEVMENIDKYWFWYYNIEMDKPILSKPLKLK